MVVGIPLQTGQPITLVGEGRRRHSLISINDVAAFAAATVGNHSAMNQHLVLGGPADVSWRDVVDEFSRALGTQLPVQFVAPGEAIPGLPEIVQPVLAAMETY